MVDAFKSVLTVSLRPPCNPDYEQFLDRTRNYSYGEPFLSPIPVIPGLKMDVSISLPQFVSYSSYMLPFSWIV